MPGVGRFDLFCLPGDLQLYLTTFLRPTFTKLLGPADTNPRTCPGGGGGGLYIDRYISNVISICMGVSVLAKAMRHLAYMQLGSTV